MPTYKTIVGLTPYLESGDITDKDKYVIEIGQVDDVNEESKGMTLTELKQLLNITLYQNLKTKTDNYDLLITDDYIILNAALHEVNLTLPLIDSTIHGKMYVFYCYDATEGASIVCSGSDNILQSGSSLEFNSGESYRVIADNGSGYWIIIS